MVNNNESKFITLGDWCYDVESHDIIYANHIRLSLDENQKFLLKKMIELRALRRSNFGEATKLYAQLRLSIPESMLKESWKVFESLLKVERKKTSKNIVEFENASESPKDKKSQKENNFPWLCDENGISFRGKVLRSINHNSSTQFQEEMIQALIESYPAPITMRRLIKIAEYDPNEKDLLSRRRIRGRIDIFNKMLMKNFKLEDKPILFSEPKDGYILNLSLSEIKNLNKSRQPLEKYGPLTICETTCQIWINDTRLKDIGLLEWDIMEALMNSPGQYIETSHLNFEIFGDERGQFHAIQQSIARTRRKINAIEIGLGDTLLQSHHGKGYGLFVPSMIKKANTNSMAATI